MPAARARSALAGLRPDSRVRTSAPLSRNRRPTPDPIVPCAITPIIVITYLRREPTVLRVSAEGIGGKSLTPRLCGAPRALAALPGDRRDGRNRQSLRRQCETPRTARKEDRASQRSRPAATC